MLRHLSILLSLGAALLWAQCPPLSSLPPAPSCDNCEKLEVNGGSATVPVNQTRCVPADVSISLNNLTLNNGSTLIICGEVALNGWLNLNNNVTIYIAPSGRLDAQGINDNPKTVVYNYGIVNLSNSLNLNGNTSRFYNIGSGAQLNVGGDINVNSSDGLINYGGLVNANHLRINGSGSICTGYNGCFSVGNFTSNGNNKIEVVGSDPAAITFSGQSTINGGSVTNSSNLLVCQAPTATQSGSGSWGSAQVYNNCSQGCGILPYAALRVYVDVKESAVLLRWHIEGAFADRVTYYIVRESAIQHELGRTPHTYLHLERTFLPEGREYIFEVQGYGAEGQLLARGITRVAVAEEKPLRVYPTNFSQELRYISPEPQKLTLMSMTGQILGHLDASAGEGTWQTLDNGMPLSALSAGIYLLRDEAGRAIRLMKQP